MSISQIVYLFVMSEVVCEGNNCTALAGFRCTKCKDLGFSKSFGNYCGAVCQTNCFASHKILHKCKTKLPKTGVAWTIVIALHELFFINKLPVLNVDGKLSVYLLGCRTGFESLDTTTDCIEYTQLFDLLKATLYPSLTLVEVVLNGLELQELPSVKTSCVSLRYVCSASESLAPTLNFASAVVVIMGPGFSDNVDSWEPVIHYLLAMNVVTITTGYSHGGSRLTYDAVHDERTLATYFLANIIVPSTSNPAQIVGRPEGARKNAFYVIFQGRTSTPSPTIISRQELHRANQIAFLKDLAYSSLEFEGDAALSKRCLTAAQGKAPFAANATLKQLDQFVMYG